MTLVDASQDQEALQQRAMELHRGAIVIDGLAGKVLDPSVSQAGGVTAGILTLAWRLTEDFVFAAKQVAGQLDFARFCSDQVLVVRSVEDVERAKKEGKLGLILGFQSTTPLGNDRSLVNVFHALGVRVIELTYMEQTLAGCGCLEPNDTGLTAFGQQIIREMERLGVLLDLSHVGRRTSLDALKYAKQPCVFSHSNAAGLFETPRNINDDQIRAVADTGGLVGITPYAPFFCRPDDHQPSVTDVIDHVSYVANLVGIDHVAIGTDAFEGESAAYLSTGSLRIYAESIGPWPPERLACTGLVTRRDFPNVTVEMVRRGFSDEEILKVLGANWMRVFAESWRGEES